MGADHCHISRHYPSALINLIHHGSIELIEEAQIQCKKTFECDDSCKSCIVLELVHPSFGAVMLRSTTSGGDRFLILSRLSQPVHIKALI